MTETTITELLKRLHGMLEQSTSIGDQDRKLLRQLSLDIQELLERPGAAGSAEHRPLLEQLKDAIYRLEASHPDLTTTLAAVSKRLSDMGI